MHKTAKKQIQAKTLNLIHHHSLLIETQQVQATRHKETEKSIKSNDPLPHLLAPDTTCVHNK